MNKEEEFITRHEVKEVVRELCVIGFEPNAFGGFADAQAQMGLVNTCNLEVRICGR